MGSNPTFSDFLLKFMLLYINASSKDKNSLSNLINLINKVSQKSITVRIFQKKNTKKIISVLKSPHVNKKAQEQFEYRTYNVKLVIDSLKPFKLFYILKKLKNECLPGVFLKLETLTYKSEKFKKTVEIKLNPEKLNTRFFQKKLINTRVVFLNRYLKIFDSYGRLILSK